MLWTRLTKHTTHAPISHWWNRNAKLNPLLTEFLVGSTETNTLVKLLNVNSLQDRKLYSIFAMKSIFGNVLVFLYPFYTFWGTYYLLNLNCWEKGKSFYSLFLNSVWNVWWAGDYLLRTLRVRNAVTANAFHMTIMCGKVPLIRPPSGPNSSGLNSESVLIVNQF